MFLNLPAVFLILSLAIGAKATPSPKCAWLVGPGEKTRQNYLKHLINMRVGSITSTDSISTFFMQIGEFNSHEHNSVKEMSDLVFRELGESGAKRIARNLMLIHRHQAQEALSSVLVGYKKGEIREAVILERSFRTPFDEDVFSRWVALGEDLVINRAFLAKLRLAIEDLVQFEPFLRNYLDRDLTVLNVLEGLKKLNNSSLVGQFMERFLKADRLTRQYIFSEVIELKDGAEGKRTVALKGTSTPGEKFEVDESISGLLDKSLEILQEKAFFSYESNGDSRRPSLKNAKEKKAAALRFLNRRNYDLTEADVRYATGVLAEHPQVDDAVDTAMRRALEVPESTQFFKFAYAELELLIFQRMARGLTSIEPDLHHTFVILSTKTDCLKYLKNLLIFHEKIGLVNYPKLKSIVVRYFRENPSSFTDLLNTGADIRPAVEKFSKDFHVSEPR